MSHRFFPLGVCGGSGSLDEDRICESKAHAVDCNCSACSVHWWRAGSPPECWVRCSECGSVFDCFLSWHESASGKAPALVGKGIGIYQHQHAPWDQMKKVGVS